MVLEHRKSDEGDQTNDEAIREKRRISNFNVFDPKDVVVGMAGGQNDFVQDNFINDKSVDFINEENGAIVEPILAK